MNLETYEMRTVKIYRKDELTPELVAMLTKEICHFQTLDHPNIVKCFEVLEDRNKVYLILENFQGNSLYEYVMHHGELTEA